MLTDFDSLQEGQSLDCDLCIIGGGAAGITIAREFIGSSKTVLLLESGGLDYESATQALYDFENLGLPRIRDTRFRFFGGTTNVWDSRCAELGAIDFAKREWVSESGWPIGIDALAPFSAKAHDVANLRELAIGDQLASILGVPELGLDTQKVRPHFWQYPPGQPVRFGIAYRQQLAQAANVNVLLHANATNIQTAASGREVAQVDIRSLSGRRGRVRARRYVLCCGGIENARLLLASNTVNRYGLGNERDLVGRYLMEHPRAVCADVAAADPYWFRRTFSGYWRPSDGAHFVLGLDLAPELQREKGLLNCGALFYYEDDPASGTKALLRLLGRENIEQSAAQMLSDVRKVMADIGEVVTNARGQVLEPGKDNVVRTKRITVTCDVEQAPNPASRVTLSRNRDALGIPLSRIDWRVSDAERRTILAMMTAVGEDFGRLGRARLRLADWLTDAEAENPYREVHHHIGTTRMSDSAATGVVNADLRLHGVANLYVAGSSVFPTSGHVNPTLTILTLAYRLADHLRSLR
jgi:choline dehydrogenase-like flavoprotein